MLSQFLTHKQVRVATLLVCFATSIVGCISAVSPDTVKEGISMEEAQKLLLFQVCLPEYVPAGVAISDTVTYHAEFGDPNESDVTIDYFGVDNENPVFSIYERHGPGKQVDFSDDAIQSASLSKLLDWQVDWVTIEDFNRLLDELEKYGIVEYQVYSFDSERLIVEIKSPENLNAVMITWKLSQYVLIDIYSRLSVEETKLIANSVPHCNPIPTATP